MSKCWQKYQFLTIRTVVYRRLLRRHDVEGESGFCPVKWWSSSYQAYKRLPCFKGDRRAKGALGRRVINLCYWCVTDIWDPWGSPLSYIQAQVQHISSWGVKQGSSVKEPVKKEGSGVFNHAGTMWSVGLESLLQHSFRIKDYECFSLLKYFFLSQFNVQK